MGCLCSKGISTNDYVAENESKKEDDKSSVQLVAPSTREEIEVEVGKGNRKDGSVLPIPKTEIEDKVGSVHGTKDFAEGNKNRIIGRIQSGNHQRRATLDSGLNGGQSMSVHGDGKAKISRINSMPGGTEFEEIAAGWPEWLTSVAGEAIQGWIPRSAESFEKLNKIGQGTYSSVYKARDLKINKIVAMKKVRFVNMDPESVRFMAREICILRRLDHPNIMKLEALVTSRMSGSLYLVFEYMEHDLSGLAASPKIKFSEPQIKCYMQQLLCGLEHCHSRGVLHRDIKGSNLLIDNNGILKIADFGLSTVVQPDKKQPLTSRVVTLWYRAPELLLGATDYGVAIDMWSAGCILAELFAGKPIMPGRTEVEQMHKIFKLCGSPSEQYWRRKKLPHATSFKPHRPYKRRVAETFQDLPPSALGLVDVLLAMEPEERGTAASALKSEFFMTSPLACDPSTLPKYPPSKEFDAKLRDEEEKRRKAEAVKGHGPESVRRGHRESKGNVPTPEFNAQVQSNKCVSVKYNPHEDSGAGFPIEPPRGMMKNGKTCSSSMIHPKAVGSWISKVKEEAVITRQRSHMPHSVVDSSIDHHKKEERAPTKEAMGYVPKRNRILCSGPLVPPGGNMEDMLKEHERQIQEAVRKARLDKDRTKKNCYDFGNQGKCSVPIRLEV